MPANNMTLTILERLKSRVANMPRQLDAAVEARDQEIVRQAAIQQRMRDREANDAALKSMEEDAGVSALFGAEE